MNTFLKSTLAKACIVTIGFSCITACNTFKGTVSGMGQDIQSVTRPATPVHKMYYYQTPSQHKYYYKKTQTQTVSGKKMTKPMYKKPMYKKTTTQTTETKMMDDDAATTTTKKIESEHSAVQTDY